MTTAAVMIRDFTDLTSGDVARMLEDASDDANEIAFDLADAITEALQEKRDLTASAAARAAKCNSQTAWEVLRYLVRHGYAHTSGNGKWTHYHPGRR